MKLDAHSRITLNRRDVLRGGSAATLGFGLGIGLKRTGLARQSATPIASPVESSALEDLRKRLTGKLLVPGDDAYESAGLPANGRYLSIRPIAIAQCADEADVVTCVNWSRENGVPPVARGGGHSYAGFSTTNGLLVDIGRLNSVAIDADGIMTTGGAALNQNLFDSTVNTSRFLPGGTCLGVGLGGLTLGGGIGYNTHWAGLTCDRLRASRMVTAAGEVIEIDESNNSDLFWASRGGAGGNFGINTSFTYELVPAPDNVTFYRFDWRGADAAAEVFAAFHTMLQSAPPELNAVFSAQASEVGNGGPREAIDLFSRGQYIGPIGELQEIVAPLLAAATPTKQTLEEKTFWDMQTMFASTETESHSYGDISRYAAEPIPDSAVATLIDLLANCPSRTATANGSIWSLGWIGGDVVNSIGRTDTAYVHRDMLTLLRPTPVWENDAPASVGDGLIAWTNEVVEALNPYTPDESYQNFPNRLIGDWQTAYYAENFERLVDVKTTYDGGNLFQNPQSIPPRG
ncbi:FAD-binding oxidoreductase [soil metagenome]